MGKYDPLSDYLSARPGPVNMSFDHISQLVGGLPPSASRWRAWWANDASHVHARAWLDTGHRVESVNLESGAVSFH